MKIGLDFDGVVSDCGKLKSDGAKELYGVEIPPHKFKKEIVIGEGHLTSDQYRELQRIIYGTRKIGFLMELVSGVAHYIPRLVDEGHEILVVTSRSETALQIAKEWTHRQGLSLNFVGVGYGNSKEDAAQGLDVYIDDDLDKLEPLVGVVQNLFLFSWGYNEHIQEGKVAQRIVSWEEFYQVVQELS